MQSSLHNIASDILNGINNNETSMLCFLDLQNVLTRLITIYYYVNLKNTVFMEESLFFKHYLSGHKQRINVTGQESSF